MGQMLQLWFKLEGNNSCGWFRIIMENEATIPVPLIRKLPGTGSEKESEFFGMSNSEIHCSIRFTAKEIQKQDRTGLSFILFMAHVLTITHKIYLI